MYFKSKLRSVGSRPELPSLLEAWFLSRHAQRLSSTPGVLTAYSSSAMIVLLC
jgi:lipopolysaccharide/colanic/teichoic acid biosynthesis glycosyltransferase